MQIERPSDTYNGLQEAISCMKNFTKEHELHTLLHRIHHLLEAAEGKRITREEMARRLRVSPRTYVEYLRGTNAPIGMRALLDMLAMLSKEELVRIIDEWKKNTTGKEDGCS